MRTWPNRLALFIVLAIAAWSGNARAAITISENPVNVGNVLIGTTEFRDVTLNGEGEMVNLVLDEMTCSGGGGTFTFSDTSLHLNMERGLRVFYNATASGIRSCTVYLYEGQTYRGQFGVRANGQRPQKIVASLSLPTNFGSVRYNDASPLRQSTRTLTIQNDGDRTLEVSSLMMNGANAADFKVTAGPALPRLIGGGGSASWTITFNPVGTTAGPRSATLAIGSNDEASPTTNIALDGTATTASIDVTTPTNYGIVPIGFAKSLDVTVTNTAAANKGPLGVTSASIAVTGGPATPSWFTFSACGTATTTCNFAPALSINLSTLVGVKCAPPAGAGTGTQMARVTFASDADAGAVYYSDLSCTAGSSDLRTNMTTVTFAPQLVFTTMTQQITVMNAGNQSGDFTLAPTGTLFNQFSATGPGCGVAAACPLPPGASTTITVTFTPTIEGPVSAGFNINTAAGGPPISLAGRGIDRHLAIEGPVRFEDTYRNPLDNPPRIDVPITNTGEYPLEVLGLDFEVAGDPSVWALAEPFAPFAVPPLSTTNVGVLFLPRIAGKAPDARLRITTDDRRDSTLSGTPGVGFVMLSGNGKDRNVDMVPGSIDMGETFAGVPMRLSITRPGDLITVVNQDLVPFRIRDIAIEGAHASAFVLQDLNGNSFTSLEIGPGEMQQFDLVFTPSYPGQFEATLALYLDQDPDAQKPVPIRGTAQFVDAHGDYVASASASYAANPFVLGTDDGDVAIVRHHTMLSLGGAYAFEDRYEAGARLPLYLQTGDGVMVGTSSVAAPSGAAAGDLALHIKARLWRDAQLRLGGAFALTLPTATKSSFTGARLPTARLVGLLSYSPLGPLTLHANLGGIVRESAQYANLDQGSGFTWGAGASFRAFERVFLTAEAFGDAIPSGTRARPTATDPMGAPATLLTFEALAGARVQLTRQYSLGAAVGRGLTSDLGAPELRGVVTFAYVPGAPELAPLRRPKVEQPVDLTQEDSDVDRLNDAEDKCPEQPEDKDGFEDDDGCPDPDNDRDGTLDTADKCSGMPEDKDQFEDSDGCPDLDNDRDGVNDADDKCPGKPEKINGKDDNDGCPDTGDSVVISNPDRLELLEPVVFNGTAVARSSTNVLTQLAATLRARSDIRRLRITVHVNPSKMDKKDQALTDKRAAAVKAWLVDWGIAADRIEARGFGGSKPLIPPTQKGADVINERVELIILERE